MAVDAAVPATTAAVAAAETAFSEATAANGLSGFFCFPASAAAETVFSAETAVVVAAAATNSLFRRQAPSGACFPFARPPAHKRRTAYIK